VCERSNLTMFFLVRIESHQSAATAPAFNYPTCIWHHRWGWPRLSFAKIFGIRKLESLGYHHRLVTCDRQLHGHTHTHTAQTDKTLALLNVI